MRITWNELTVKPDTIDLESLLTEWRWLVDDTYTPLVLGALGDLFLRRDDGRIFWLDTGWGELHEIAESREAFQAAMVEPENADEWFVPNLVGDLLTSGLRLGPGQCFGYKVPPTLGGEPEIENFEAVDMAVYFGVLGQVQRQVRELPPGTPVSAIVIAGTN